MVSARSTTSLHVGRELSVAGEMGREGQVGTRVSPAYLQELGLLGDDRTVVFSEYFGVLDSSSFEGSEEEGAEGKVSVEVDERVDHAVK